MDEEIQAKFDELEKKIDEFIKNFDTQQIQAKFDELEKEFKELVIKVNEEVDLLSQANIDLILIEIHSIANNLSYAEELLDNIGTLKQFENLREIEKRQGINMAYTTAKSYLESAGSDARSIKPTLKAIRNSMDKISKKLKYASEA